MSRKHFLPVLCARASTRVVLSPCGHGLMKRCTGAIGPWWRWHGPLLLVGVLAVATLSGCQSIANIRPVTAQKDELSPMYAEDLPDDSGFMEMRLGDASIILQADGCSGRMISKLICSNARVTISTPMLRRQTLLLPEVWIPRAIPPNSPEETGYRGSLAEGFGNGVHSIMLSDINVDGYEDLIIWSGSDGTYGDPSYTYFLYDARARRFVENKPLAKLMEWHSLSRIIDGRLFAWYRSGPCDRGEKVIGIRDGAAKLLASRDYTTCGENALDSEKIFDDSWMKLEGEPT